jgi:Uma2 family endonuclease
MSTALKGKTLADYLEQETATRVRHEYYRGEVFAMVGGTPRHSLIATNFLRESSQLLKNRPCVAYGSDLRIKVDDSGLYTYPDASIVYGELKLDDEIPNTVLNPTVLVEVLSESTESYDRGKKSDHYRRIASLQTLVLISQDRPLVEWFSRHEPDGWILRDAREMDQSLVLDSVGISIPLSELYRNVQFDPTDASARVL